MASARPYEVVVWGATGTVGKLVCEHVAQHYQVTKPANSDRLDQLTLNMSTHGIPCLNAVHAWLAWPALECTHLPSVDHGMQTFQAPFLLQGRIKWAIAGRNQAKLESIRSHVAEMNPECKVCCCSVHVRRSCLQGPAQINLPDVQQTSNTCFMLNSECANHPG